MTGNAAPQIVQYQGSKRKLAPVILKYVPLYADRFVEPFAGMAAMSIAAAMDNRAKSFWLNDVNEPVVGILRSAVESPEDLLSEYAAIWKAQFEHPAGHLAHFYAERDLFNEGDAAPARMLYLVARCVKGSVRYGKDGRFNQSPDKRRHGTKPENMRRSILKASALLRGRVVFSSLDYREVFARARQSDILYLDPPYQGTSRARDRRYCADVPLREFAEALSELNARGVPYLASYDGVCGATAYGEELPSSLGCRKIMLAAGPSAQATLLGRRSDTTEALYLSPALQELLEAEENAGRRQVTPWN